MRLDDHLSEEEKKLVTDENFWDCYKAKQSQAIQRRCLVGLAIGMALGLLLIVVLTVCGVKL